MLLIVQLLFLVGWYAIPTLPWWLVFAPGFAALGELLIYLIIFLVAFRK